ncbi:T-cell surface protein tactile [Triplophysa rosa]|uniref:T-cell surface protein tactile n=1 Tax=Triplophysa rosa TaxID=992332 RepID=UPI002545BF40|nr:T-cell surface protein tactile [Triplophysa rosa]XP_057177219.1 T-cell surface protein tactile [Triplophysa rosa]
MKGNTTVSSSDTLSLSSVTSNQSGTYKLTAAFYNNQLWTDTEFSIHVLPEMSKGFTTETTSSVRSFSTLYPFFSQTTEPRSNFTSVETSSVPTTLTTSESSHFLTSTAQPNATMTTEHRHTSRHSLLNNSSPASPAGNASTLHPDFVNPSNTSFSFNLSTTAISKTGSKLGTFVVTSKSTIIYTTGTAVRIEKVSNRATYIVIPILLLLLILIVLLYRKHLTKKKMNMPPSFKPPPPPVKYTSVRNHDVLMTDILV